MDKPRKLKVWRTDFYKHSSDKNPMEKVNNLQLHRCRDEKRSENGRINMSTDIIETFKKIKEYYWTENMDIFHLHC